MKKPKMMTMKKKTMSMKKKAKGDMPSGYEKGRGTMKTQRKSMGMSRKKP